MLLEGETLRAAQAGYFGLIEQLDEQIAPLIAEFKERSRKAKRPWVILLTSDHGEMLGDHGFYRKCEPFEGSANIPFLVAGSPELGFQGRLALDAAGLPGRCDAYLAGVGGREAGPSRWTASAWCRCCAGQEQVVRECLHFEHAPCYSQQQAFHALTDGQFKYIWRPVDGTEHLFDLTQDPREERDLAKVAVAARLAGAMARAAGGAARQPARRLLRRHQPDYRPALSGASGEAERKAPARGQSPLDQSE